MTPAPRGRSSVAALASALGLAATLLLAGCATPPASATPATPPASTPSGPPASASPAAGTPVALVSPVIGRLVKLDAEGLTRVKGFTLRLDDGSEVAFVIGTLENGGEFPPGHLAEHMASSSAVRVLFRDEGGAHVVYRLEDGE